MINLFLAKLAYKADNWAGDGKKILGYTFLAFCFLFPVVPLMASMGAWGMLLIPYTFFCALAYRKWGAWGEIFVHDNDTFDPKHKWFYRLVDKVYGYKYVTLTSEEKKLWKVIGWGCRYAIYCLPISALYAYANFARGDFFDILNPFIFIPIAGFMRGGIYWYGLKYENLAWCEKWGGAAAMFLIVSSGL